jgi:putative sigma-54 modulation protein
LTARPGPLKSDLAWFAAVRHSKGLLFPFNGGIVKPLVEFFEFFGLCCQHVAGNRFNPESNRRLFMNLTISGHHLEVTPALRSYVTTKLDRINRHFDQVVDVKVLLTVEKQKEKDRRQRAECNIHVKGCAESAHADLYAAVDELVDKLDRQVVRHKDRVQDHHHEAPKRLM